MTPRVRLIEQCPNSGQRVVSQSTGGPRTGQRGHAGRAGRRRGDGTVQGPLCVRLMLLVDGCQGPSQAFRVARLSSWWTGRHWSSAPSDLTETKPEKGSEERPRRVEEYVVHIGGPPDGVLQDLDQQRQSEPGQRGPPQGRPGFDSWGVRHEGRDQPAERDEQHDVAEDVDQAKGTVDIGELEMDARARNQVRSTPRAHTSATEGEGKDGQRRHRQQ